MTTAVLHREPEHVQTLVTRLTAEYGDRLGADTVADTVRSCYQPLAQARITAYVPVLVEHASRDRLRRLAKPAAVAASAGGRPQSARAVRVG